MDDNFHSLFHSLLYFIHLFIHFISFYYATIEAEKDRGFINGVIRFG